MVRTLLCGLVGLAVATGAAAAQEREGVRQGKSVAGTFQSYREGTRSCCRWRHRRQTRRFPRLPVSVQSNSRSVSTSTGTNRVIHRLSETSITWTG